MIYPVTHKSVADKYNLDMRDPLTRMIIAALYWQERAEHWRTLAQRPGNQRARRSTARTFGRHMSAVKAKRRSNA